MTKIEDRIRGEIVRIRHRMTIARANLDAVELMLRDAECNGVAPDPMTGQAIYSTAADIAVGLAKLAAFILVGSDGS